MKILFLQFLFMMSFSVSAWAGAVPGEYIIRIKKTVSDSSLKSFKAAKVLDPRRRVAKIKVKSEAELNELLSSSEIEVIEPNYTVTAGPVAPTEMPPEAVEPSVEEAASLAPTQLAEAWLFVTPLDKGIRPIVAVIDSGIDPAHPVFVNTESIWENEKEKNGRPGTDDDGNGFVDDVTGWDFISASGTLTDESKHGTHVSGIVLSADQDILSGSFQKSKIRIMPLKFLNGSGVGTTADAIQAIYYAVDNGAAVINNSWGGSNYSRALADAYEYANSKGVVITSAAGNYSSNNDELSMYPANYGSANNISVMATYNNDSKAGFSNFGLKTVSIAAPGVSVISSVPGDCAGGCFTRMSGTSMAAPFVAGVAAMLKREAPNATAAKMKSIILDSADPVQALAGMSVTGARINVFKSVLKAQSEAESDTRSEVTSAPAIGTGSSGGGCGLVMASQMGDKRSGFKKFSDRFLFFTLLTMPLFIAVIMRNRFKIAL